MIWTVFFAGDASATCHRRVKATRNSVLSIGLVTGLIGLTGCQPSNEPQQDEVTIAARQKAADASVSGSYPSAQAQAQIDAYEPKFIAQMLNLQQRLKAEYESLQVADATDEYGAARTYSNEAVESDKRSSKDIAGNNESPNPETESDAETTPESETTPDSEPMANSQDTTTGNEAAETESSGLPNAEDEVLSTEVGERDLTVLKQISLEPSAPEMLSKDELKKRYREAFSELYGAQPLSAQAVNTLINITTLLPDIFEQPELARQLSDKSPALARLIVQHQVWRQIEAQQVIDMQRMKRKQQAEFERLMTKFNETIEGYDEQIVKYEQMLKEFEQQ